MCARGEADSVHTPARQRPLERAADAENGGNERCHKMRRALLKRGLWFEEPVLTPRAEKPPPGTWTRGHRSTGYPIMFVGSDMSGVVHVACPRLDQLWFASYFLVKK